MKVEKMIKELRRLEEKHKNDTIFTGGNNWSLMCKDVANKIEELNNNIILVSDEMKNHIGTSGEFVDEKLQEWIDKLN